MQIMLLHVWEMAGTCRLLALYKVHAIYALIECTGLSLSSLC